jgi:hypothetical protein
VTPAVWFDEKAGIRPVAMTFRSRRASTISPAVENVRGDHVSMVEAPVVGARDEGQGIADAALLP